MEVHASERMNGEQDGRIGEGWKEGGREVKGGKRRNKWKREQRKTENNGGRKRGRENGRGNGTKIYIKKEELDRA